MKKKFVTCHRKPERSFFYKGKQFPLCARCTGIYAGYVSILFFAVSKMYLPVWLSLVLILPTIIDGVTQTFGNRESSNAVRFLTGIMAGVGVSSLITLLADIFVKATINFFTITRVGLN